jgi:hypothetical protein
MTKLGDIASGIKARVIREVSHAPVSFVAAIITLIDVGSKLAAGSHLPPAVPAQSSVGQFLSFPQPLALLEFLGFQVVIAFIADWLNERAIRFGASAGVIVGLFTAVLAAYLLTANAYQLAYFLIKNERSNPGAFVDFVLIGSLIIFALMGVFLVERNFSQLGALDLAFLLISRIAPFLFVLVAALSFFEPMFEARLYTLYNGMFNR